VRLRLVEVMHGVVAIVGEGVALRVVLLVCAVVVCAERRRARRQALPLVRRQSDATISRLEWSVCALHGRR
jgi:hypothetical protein